MARVLAMLSGGVDSNVVAYLLKQQGHEVIGCTLALWYDGDSGTCCGVAANCRAKDVCDKLGIEHYALNKRMDFMKYVVNPYIEAHKAGTTPSPCLNCNTNVKIGGMLKYADYFRCDYVATGHYVRMIDGRINMAADKTKDQSYMLSMVKPNVLPRLMFPLGDMLKTEVRAIAEKNNIYAPSDSQDLCFVEKTDRAEFLQQYGVVFEEGEIVNTAGETIGKHDGIYNFTVGQRKGLPANNSPLYVIRIDKDKNKIVAGNVDDLMVKSCVVSGFNWQHTPNTNRVGVKIRYRALPVMATYECVGDKVHLMFDEPVKSITPGQAAVMYCNDQILIGGGWID